MIGRPPVDEILTITPGQDFTHTVKPPGAYIFQDGTTLKIALFKDSKRGTPEIVSWPATVTQQQAKWLIQSEVTDLLTIDHSTWFRLYISYPDSPTTDHCWFSGSVLHSP